VEVANGAPAKWPAALDWRSGRPLARLCLNGTAMIVQVEKRPLGWRLSSRGFELEVSVLAARHAELLAKMPEKAPPDTSKFLLSPMPGLLKSVAVKAGQAVKAGEELAVVEAMKMENVLRAERDGAVKALHAKPGESLQVDQVIVEFG
jgi:propionyl-CoA carboxylase alpha chain